jgi:hypothetical protein
VQPYDILVWIHIVLFVYWLGPDWGVYVISPAIWDAKRPIAERLATLRQLVRMAQVSRNCLILLLPVGLVLAASLGVSRVNGAGLVLALGFALAWFALSVAMYRRAGSALAERLNRIDYGLRWFVMLGMIALGLASYFTAKPFDAPWLAAKAVLYGLLIGNSLQQRGIARRWLGALKAIEAAGGSDAKAETVFAATARRSQWNAYFTWSASIAIAFLGATKPYF